MKPNEIYESVTKTIIELLEDHQQTWERPWIAFGQDNDLARNPVTGQRYRGINQFLLSYRLMKKGYLKNTWMTFNQVKDKNGFIGKGEKSTPVLFFKTAYLDKNKKYIPPEAAQAMSHDQLKAQGIESVPVVKLFAVFNIAQTSGLKPEWYEVTPQEPLQPFEKDERAEALIRSTGADIEITQSNRAFYDRTKDKIVLPLREQFVGTEPFYSTGLHELGHWTGHETRLDRLQGISGETEYAKEELVAELTSAFCCAVLGFTKTITSNAAYLANWLTVLKNDHKAFVKAAAQAQKAADYILECSQAKELAGEVPTYMNH